eukprot:12352716-Alexandrium_andersonii.AAC.1
MCIRDSSGALRSSPVLSGALWSAPEAPLKPFCAQRSVFVAGRAKCSLRLIVEKCSLPTVSIRRTGISKQVFGSSGMGRIRVATVQARAGHC